MKYKKYIYVFMMCIGILSLSGCKQDEDISAWIVEWDLDRGINEVDSLYKNLSSTQLFAAYFDESGKLFLPDSLKESDYFNELESKDNIYITVVNDIVKKDGSSVQKDSEIMRDILTNEEKYKSHIKELVSLVSSDKFVGLELDYEKIDEDIWENYAQFIDELGQELKKNNKKLRVVLEPRSPIDKVDLPSEYEYVMMAYNLYGYHSGPGPKADINFIESLSKKCNTNLKDVRMAFSLGGFDWTEEEKPKALTEIEAKKILDETQSEMMRDAKSGAVYFNYKDENLKNHSVWYCDSETLSIWMDTAKKYNINKFALWRLGGNI